MKDWSKLEGLVAIVKAVDAYMSDLRRRAKEVPVPFNPSNGHMLIRID